VSRIRQTPAAGLIGRRYTVHEKAQNFMVPLPLSHGWHDEQIDELFSSLLGGAGMRGAGAETAVNASGVIDGDEGLASLGGLRVF
jgi:protein AATF/BFR2